MIAPAGNPGASGWASGDYVANARFVADPAASRVERLAPLVQDGDGRWTAGCVRLRFVATQT